MERSKRINHLLQLASRFRKHAPPLGVGEGGGGRRDEALGCESSGRNGLFLVLSLGVGLANTH